MTRDAKFHVECRVGRLIEVQIESLTRGSDVARLQHAMGDAFNQAGPSAIACGDCRKVEVLSPDAGEALVEMLKRDNSLLERSAVLLSATNAIFDLQIERMFREAPNPARRAFRDPAPLLIWLAEVLRPDELFRARQFLHT